MAVKTERESEQQKLVRVTSAGVGKRRPELLLTFIFMEFSIWLLSKAIYIRVSISSATGSPGLHSPKQIFKYTGINTKCANSSTFNQFKVFSHGKKTPGNSAVRMPRGS